MGLFSLKGYKPKARADESLSNGTLSSQYTQPPHPIAPPKSTSDPSPAYHQPTFNAPPPPGPPPSDPPPYHDWTVIPDTATLPPPPSVGHEQPYTNNADPDEAGRAHDWCNARLLLLSHQPLPTQVAAVRDGQINLIRPQEYKGDLHQMSVGCWDGSTKANMRDACLLTSLPLYFASNDSPGYTGRPITIYFEVEIRSTRPVGWNEESTLALGFCALPQPTWRLPGWERASLGVHSDDGHRYVNDPWGGKDFTAPFKPGDTIGLGMSMKVPDKPPEYNIDSSPPPIRNMVEVFLTRNGKKDNAWDLNEELDNERDQPVDGLNGLYDLYGAVGVFGGVDFVVKFKREHWLWRPH